MSQRIAVVTGANKGIGKAIVRNLVLQSKTPLLVYLTGRNISLAEKASEDLRSEPAVKNILQKAETVLKVKQLDITDEKSIQTFADYIVEQHSDREGSPKEIIDLLVNNAGIASKGSTFNIEIVRDTVGCNYYGTQQAIRILLPLMKRDGKARIVNVSSGAGKLRNLPSQKLRDEFSSPSLTMQDLDRLMKKFDSDVASGQYKEQGWPSAAYSVSKVGLTAMTNVLARGHKDILINSCCPGWVATDMAGPNATKTPDQGAETPVLLSIGDIGNATGEFWENGRKSTW